MIYYRYVNSGKCVWLSEYRVSKVTPLGVRLDNGRLVIHTHWKRFAHPTVAQAQNAFLARKRRQLGIVKSQALDVEAILARKDPFENSAGFDLVDVFDSD